MSAPRPRRDRAPRAWLRPERAARGAGSEPARAQKTLRAQQTRESATRHCARRSNPRGDWTHLRPPLARLCSALVRMAGGGRARGGQARVERCWSNSLPALADRVAQRRRRQAAKRWSRRVLTRCCTHWRLPQLTSPRLPRAPSEPALGQRRRLPVLTPPALVPPSHHHLPSFALRRRSRGSAGRPDSRTAARAVSSPPVVWSRECTSSESAARRSPDRFRAAADAVPAAE